MSFPRETLSAIGASSVLTSVADLTGGVFTFAMPVEIVSFGMIITVALDDGAGGGGVLALDKRITAGSDTGRVANVATLTLTNAQAQPTKAPAGNVIRCRPDSLSTAFAGPAPAEAALAILPGQQAVLKCTDVLANAGTGLPFIEYRQLPRADRAASIELIVSA